MKFGQLIEYNTRNFLKNHAQNVVEKLVPDPCIKTKPPSSKDGVKNNNKNNNNNNNNNSNNKLLPVALKYRIGVPRGVVVPHGQVGIFNLGW